MSLFRQHSSYTVFRSRTAVAMTMLLSIGLGGCGGPDERATPQGLEPLTGQVTLNGKPADGVSLNFNPARGNKGEPGFAMTDAEGNFTARHITQTGTDVDPATYGLEPGDYTVTFSRLRLPDGSPLPTDIGEDGTPAASLGAKQTLPNKYTLASEDMGGMRVKVPYEGEKLVFELKVKE